MTKEEMKIYAEKYRKTQSKLSIGMAIFIFIIALVLIAAATSLIIYAKGAKTIYVVAIIMLILSIADIYIGIRFITFSKKKYKKMSDKEAAEHYCKIHGYNQKLEKEKRD